MLRWRLEKRDNPVNQQSQVCLIQGNRQNPVKCWADNQRNFSYYYNTRYAILGKDVQDYDGIDQAFKLFAKKNAYIIR